MIWVSEWNCGNVSRYDPRTGAWKTWKLPGDRPRTYAVYVDDKDMVWLSDWGANAMVRFDPATENSRSSRATAAAPTCARSSAGRVKCGRPESGNNRLVVYRLK